MIIWDTRFFLKKGKKKQNTATDNSAPCFKWPRQTIESFNFVE